MGSLSKGLIPAPRRFVLPPVPGIPWYKVRPRNRSVFSTLPSIRQTLFVIRFTTCIGQASQYRPACLRHQTCSFRLAKGTLPVPSPAHTGQKQGAGECFAAGEQGSGHCQAHTLGRVLVSMHTFTPRTVLYKRKLPLSSKMAFW